MRCRHCGATLPGDARFCHECGRPVDAGDAGGDVARPPEVTRASWLVIGSGALALLGALLLVVVIATGSIPLAGQAPLIVGILALNFVLGGMQLASGYFLRRRLRWAFRLALIATGLALLISLADVAITVFTDGGSIAFGLPRILLNAFAVRSLLEARRWFDVEPAPS